MERDGYRQSNVPSFIGSAQDDRPSSSTSKNQRIQAKTRRSRISKRSCDFCKLKKLKCVLLLQDRSKCTSCEKFNRGGCTFSISQKKRGPKPKNNLNPNFSVFEIKINLADSAASSTSGGGGREDMEATGSNRSSSSRSSPSFATSADPTSLLYLDELSLANNNSFSASSLSYFTFPPVLPYSAFPTLDLEHGHPQLQPPLLHNTIRAAHDPGSIVSTSSDPNFLAFLDSHSTASSTPRTEDLDLATGYIPPVQQSSVEPNLTYPYNTYRDIFKDGIDVNQRLQNWIQSPVKDVQDKDENHEL